MELPQPTFWQFLNGRDVISAPTASRLRKLLPESLFPKLTDAGWSSLLFGPDARRRLKEYEKAISAESAAHSTAYGMATPDQGMLWVPLSKAAEDQIKRFQKWGIELGQHPARIRLAVLRIRAPFVISRYSGGLEPDVTALQNKIADDVRVVELGIKREKVLLRRAPPIFVNRYDST